MMALSSTSYAAIVSRGSGARAPLLPSSQPVVAAPEGEAKATAHSAKAEEGNDDKKEGAHDSHPTSTSPSLPWGQHRRPRPDGGSRNSSQRDDAPVFRAPHNEGESTQQQPRHSSRGAWGGLATATVVPVNRGRHQHHYKGGGGGDGSRGHRRRFPPIRPVLREMGCLESPEGNREREYALAYIEGKLREWVTELASSRDGHRLTTKRDPSSLTAKTKRGSSHDNAKGGGSTIDASAGVEEAAIDEVQGGGNGEPRVALIPFGSYRLGVHRPNSDLDCLVLTSADVSRKDFFTSWVEMLRKDPNITHVHPIPNAYTPVLKFQFRNTHSPGEGNVVQEESLQLDLLFARVSNSDKLLEFWDRRKQQQQHQVTAASSIPSIPSPPAEYYWIDNRDLPDQDAAGVRSLNGCRVTQVILQLIAGGCGGGATARVVPVDGRGNRGFGPRSPYDQRLSRWRTQRYQDVLCVVKQWAIQAGIYSNALGFLGGVNWAILVAWVCLTSPEFSDPKRLWCDGIVSSLVRRFFVVFGRWAWPNPVMLTPIELVPPRELATVTELQPWNPAAIKRDSFHIMPILTPAWPAMNSTYNVGVPHLRRMRDEFARARARLNSVPNTSVLPALFDLDNFVEQHRHFLVITMTTKRAEPADVHKQWCQFLESKLRLLVINLETTEIHPWPYSKFFHDHDDQLYRTYFCLALRFAPDVSNVNLHHLTSDWLQRINGWSGRTPSVDLKLEHTIDAKLPDCVLVEIANSSRFPGNFQYSNRAPGDATSTTLSASGSADWDSDDNGSRASDKSFASVASSFSSEVCQQTKRYRGDDAAAVPDEEENLQN